MEKITVESLAHIEAIRLDHRMLFQLDHDLIERYDQDELAEMIDALDGSRVGAYMVPYGDKSGVYLQLRCGEHTTEQRLACARLSSLIEIMPFIAAAAGRVEPEPSELDALKRRVTDLEILTGIKSKSEDNPAL